MKSVSLIQIMLFAMIGLCSSALITAGPNESGISFNRDIRPILSNNCFQCHGPDEKVRKAKLRLDTEAGALADLGGHAAIVRGKPDASEMFKRITSADPEHAMPPRKTGKTLTAREIDLLKEWIKRGARYEQHWSYVKPVRPPLPPVEEKTWVKNAIDHFIRARLAREGLRPSPEGDQYALIRRVSLDLTGLPPTWKDIEAFVNDKDPQAYEKLVDRLLAMPAFGEHWAHLWLDLARYADSAGYADDPARTIWLYRDYVIKSLNANKPFDQFTIEQIAGDLLPNPTDEQLMATAFHRNTLTNNEGGTNDEEFRNVAVVDRVNTTMAVWMGTTIHCAQCHSHKYDPISQEEYFRLFAFFNNSEDADRADESPLLSFYSEEQKRRRDALQKTIASLETTLKSQTPELKAGQAKWEAAFPLDLKWRALTPSTVKSQSNSAATLEKDGVIRVAAGAKTDTYTVDIPVDAMSVRALRLEAFPDPKLPGMGPGYANGNFVISGVKVVLIPAEGKEQPIAFTSAVADFAQGGFEAANVLNNKDPKQKGWAVGGQVGQPHALTLLTAAPVSVPAKAKLVVTIDQSYSQPNHTLGHFRLTVTDDARAAELGRTPNPVLDGLRTAVPKRTPQQTEALAKYYAGIAPELQPTRQRLADSSKQLADIKPSTVPIMRELKDAQRRKTKLQHRGNFLDLGNEVNEGVPAIFPPLPEGPKTRLALAKWLIDENNPLTARVIANRSWEQIFGIGIVATSEEFGAQGELPFHPELLDWLATELIGLKWDTKAFLKMLVTSAAYRQSSRVTPELFQRDPENRLLARGPRVRLSAEMIRDQALSVGGLLSTKMYGPSVKPPQPSSGLTAAFGSSTDWQPSTGEDRYRRGLYTTWRRSNPYPSMATFDAPNREVCNVRRVRTNTPLQALVTLNDPVYIEAAQAFARRILAEGGKEVKDRARFAFQLCLCRPAREDELARLVQLYDNTVKRLKPEQATQLATDPLVPVPPNVNVTEVAAWTVVGNVLLNLDELLMKR